MATWPSQLQQRLNAQDFQIQSENTVISTDMDYGPAKKRKRYTDSVDKVTCSINLKFEDFDILNIFFKTTLAGGSLSFDFIHPITGDIVKARFVEPPVYAPLGNGGSVLRVSMKWEFLP